MKIKESDLVIGQQYYVDEIETKGYFVGVFSPDDCAEEQGLFFYSNSPIIYQTESDGTFGFPIIGEEYEEV
jgi:hypothetical protein